MQMTTHTDYALRLLIYLGIHREDTPATVQDAAIRYRISTNHLAKVAQRLVQLGYITSQRGRGGGLELALAPDDINVGELVRNTETFGLVECFRDDSNCPIEPGCRLKHALSEANEAFLEVLDNYTLADLIQPKIRISKLLDMRPAARARSARSR